MIWYMIQVIAFLAAMIALAWTFHKSRAIYLQRGWMAAIDGELQRRQAALDLLKRDPHAEGWEVFHAFDAGFERDAMEVSKSVEAIEAKFKALHQRAYAWAGRHENE